MSKRLQTQQRVAVAKHVDAIAAITGLRVIALIVDGQDGPGVVTPRGHEGFALEAVKLVAAAGQMSSESL
jgi:hypothetical protein